MTFHRLTAPSYFGGLPAGYDMLNAGNAAVEGPKVGEPNDGTYFIGFLEDATSSRMNRAPKALGENTDILDDLMHRDLAVMRKTADAVAAAALPFTPFTVVLPPGTFLGSAGATNSPSTRQMLFTVRDANDLPIRSASGIEVVVNALSFNGGDAIGGGFSVGSVSLLLNTPVPVGTTYRVYYGVRQNLAELDVDAFVSRRAFALIYGHTASTSYAHLASAIRFAGGPAWADTTTLNPATTVEAQLDKIIGDLAGTAGAGRVGAAENLATPWGLPAGTVRSQLDTLVGALNSHLAAGHPADVISAPAVNGAPGRSLVAGALPSTLTQLLGLINEIRRPADDVLQKYLIAERIMTRTQRHAQYTAGEDWVALSGGGWEHGSAIGNQMLVYPLDVPDGSKLITLSVGVKGGPGHTALPTGPGSIVSFSVVKTSCITGDTTSLVTATPDPSTSKEDYEAFHRVDVAPAGIMQDIDNSSFLYALSISSEGGVAGRTGLRIYGVQAFFQISSLDSGAS